jgi:hypothetical protein
MEEDKSIEVIDTNQRQVRQEPRGESRVRMANSKASGKARNRIWKSFQLMKEHKSIEGESWPVGSQEGN